MVEKEKIQLKIPISRIGKLQMKDVNNANRFHDNFGRVCQVIISRNWHGDISPLRMSKLFGKPWRFYDKHFVIQMAGCPLDCSYCYVDNLKKDKYVSAKELVTQFSFFRNVVSNLNVFHLCGGDPARYPRFWKELREELDNTGLEDVILMSDTIFLEYHFYQEKPWKYLNLNNFVLVGCLKGTNKENFLINTKKDLFFEAKQELNEYVDAKNFWLTLIEYDVSGLPEMFDLVPFEKIDFLKVVNYIATQKRRKN